MKLSDYLNQLERGGKSAFARKIGAHASDLSDWMKGARPIPVRFCPAIERETGGMVVRQDCRPNDWQMYWPELADPAVPPNRAEVAHG
ncbi:transcriptional regulator [Comamonas testosteroni]|uniref:transcriptional regulator n=1 Tax=Comamonas testosteroni TaxID=285 RepID=UPI00391900CF